MPKQSQPSNPLLSKNIPPAPPVEEIEQSKTVSVDNGILVERQTTNQATPTKEDVERATIELSLYLRPSQDDKLEDLRRSYKRQTRKKISANEVIRRLIERATLDSIL